MRRARGRKIARAREVDSRDTRDRAGRRERRTRDSRASRRVRSSSADAEASARAVARPTSAPPTIVLDDAMSAWATRALDVALGGGAEDACEDACERDALVGERAGWVSDAGEEFDEERGATEARRREARRRRGRRASSP